MLALRSELACSNCRTLSTIRHVTMPRMPGCQTKLRPTGLDRLKAPLGRSRRTRSCVSFLLISCWYTMLDKRLIGFAEKWHKTHHLLNTVYTVTWVHDPLSNEYVYNGSLRLMSNIPAAGWTINNSMSSSCDFAQEPTYFTSYH